MLSPLKAEFLLEGSRSSSQRVDMLLLVRDALRVAARELRVTLN